MTNDPRGPLNAYVSLKDRPDLNRERGGCQVLGTKDESTFLGFVVTPALGATTNASPNAHIDSAIGEIIATAARFGSIPQFVYSRGVSITARVLFTNHRTSHAPQYDAARMHRSVYAPSNSLYICPLKKRKTSTIYSFF